MSVMNSRKAKNEMMPNKTKVAFLPMKNAATNIAIIDHQARVRWLRLSTTARLLSVVARRFNNMPMTVAIESNMTMPPISQ